MHNQATSTFTEAENKQSQDALMNALEFMKQCQQNANEDNICMVSDIDSEEYGNRIVNSGGDN